MEDKYYIPEIEEFHVGFEYQHAADVFIDGIKLSKDSPESWFDTSLGSDDSLSEIEVKLSMLDVIRVKYLDAEDMIELGYSQKEHSVDHQLVFVSSFELRGTVPAIAQLIYSKRSHHLLVSVCFGKSPEFQTIYAGQCKNKSKLKQILKDIGI